MYGNLIQLSGDLTASTTWRRIPVVSVGGEGRIDEAQLQEILFRHADILPLGEIDPAYNTPVLVCMELGTRAGSADALYLTPTGKIVLAEFKLWKNPGARREVVGQILDYARVLASWGYDDLDREVRLRTDRSPFDIVSEAYSGLQEHLFVDRVARNLKRGEFLLLIIGDGIREGVVDIVSYVQEHSGLRFNLALVEAAVFRRADSTDLIVQPRVLAQTELVPRTILVRRTILDETDDDPIEEHEPTPVEDENERFWTAVLRDLPLTTPGPRHRCLRGTVGLRGWQEWSSQDRPRLGFWRKAEFAEGAAVQDFEESAGYLVTFRARVTRTDAGEVGDMNREEAADPPAVDMVSDHGDQVRAARDGDQAARRLTARQRDIVAACDVPRSLAELMERAGVSHRSHFRRKHLKLLLEAGLVRMTNPGSPRAPNQKYVLTDAGTAVKAAVGR